MIDLNNVKTDYSITRVANNLAQSVNIMTTVNIFTFQKASSYPQPRPTMSM